MVQVANDNPAGRLHAILSKAKSQGDQPLRKVWAAVFDVPENDHIALFRNLISLHETIRETRELIQSAPGVDKQSYLKAFPAIEGATRITNLDADWREFKEQLSDEALARLEFSSHYLSEREGEEHISDDELKALREEVDALFDLVLESDLQRDLKTTILENLEEIRRAISDYQIKGARPIRHAVERAVGAIVVNTETYEKGAQSGLLKRFGRFLGRLDSLATKALRLKNTLTKLASLVKLIPGLGDDTPQLPGPSPGDLPESPLA